MQLRHLLSTLRDYSPPIELLSKLAPSAPFRVRQVSAQSSSSSWWKGKGRATSSEFGEGDQGRELVRVLSGEEELANLKTPKVML
jgi:protein AFG1